MEEQQSDGTGESYCLRSGGHGEWFALMMMLPDSKDEIEFVTAVTANVGLLGQALISHLSRSRSSQRHTKMRMMTYIPRLRPDG